MELSADGKQRVERYTADLEAAMQSDHAKVARELAVVKVRVEMIVELLERMTGMIKGLLP